MADANEDPKKMRPDKSSAGEGAITTTPGQGGPQQSDDKGRDPKRISEPGPGQEGQTSPSPQRPDQENPRRGSNRGGQEDYDPANQPTPKTNV